jgi:predicted phosphoribosyltransferase
MAAMRFANRTEAGRLLAGKLSQYAHRPDVVVLGLPRGGVPVAYETAQALKAPLDIMVVRKVGVPGSRELAMGALASGGVQLRNDQVMAAYRIPPEVYEAVADREEYELVRREHLYRGDMPALALHDRVVILVDDGIATGSTVRAALTAVRRSHPARSIVATPVAAAETVGMLRAECDELVCLLIPDEFLSVSIWYEEFGETSDDEIHALLGRGMTAPDVRPPGESSAPAGEDTSTGEGPGL